MANWKAELYCGELGHTVKSEYRNLLAIKKRDEDAERIIIDYCVSNLVSCDADEGHMWLALALRQWEHGRLSARVKEKALLWGQCPTINISKVALCQLISTLDSPMPKKKRVPLPSWVQKCPWPVGSLIAYRIISSDHPHVTESPFYKKYVLLRIIQIKKLSVTPLAPNDAWDDRMLVGLYNWLGDSIPDPSVADNLQFTAVSVEEPLLNTSVLQNMPLIPDDAVAKQMQQFMSRATQPRIETCCNLDWKCVKGINQNDVFTYLGCDSSYEQDVPPFFKTDITDYSMCHSIPFDAVLVNRFTQLEVKTKE